MHSPAAAPQPIARNARLPAPIDRLAGRLTNRLIRATPWQLIDVPTRKPIVSFTFDDVPDTALRSGATILEAHSVRGTFYIAGGLEGRIEADRTLIDAAGCRELVARGHEIGCHTYGHQDLRHVDRSFLAADLACNARYLDAIDPRRSRRNFAYPYNSGCLGKRPMLAHAYRSCRAGGEAINRGPTDPTFLRAVEIRQSEAHVRGLTRWIDALVADPGWLIFFTHDISPTPTPYGCTPAAFARLVGHAVERGCCVLTIDAALDRMGFRERTQ
ncbi:polysaccharide deacetylase family protein [Bradyrhizobium sp. WSM 1704]|uniref:polysaccharide deacetylase family protein n=1 Tax=Bradyrhizobium semiaridum TaxID=2821404 RepID=UPI001CE31681|nr:polysaccharide deacetylase family protein [Bradyrhizobium semiaridum]MCA6124948.1 polysaccharide deacetylase family protein [Bradyrhizobium semiaridum]